MFVRFTVYFTTIGNSLEKLEYQDYEYESLSYFGCSTCEDTRLETKISFLRETKTGVIISSQCDSKRQLQLGSTGIKYLSTTSKRAKPTMPLPP